MDRLETQRLFSRVSESPTGLLISTEAPETLRECLPRNSYTFFREAGGGIDKHNFIAWAEEFVNEVKDLTDGSRKVLLLYDGYRSHMSLKALSIFEKAGIIACAIPAHTSGTTKPLDVGLFQHL